MGQSSHLHGLHRQGAHDLKVLLTLAETHNTNASHNLYLGWWYTYPSEKYHIGNFDDYSQLNGKIKNVPNHQQNLYLGLLKNKGCTGIPGLEDSKTSIARIYPSGEPILGGCVFLRGVKIMTDGYIRYISMI